MSSNLSKLQPLGWKN